MMSHDRECDCDVCFRDREVARHERKGGIMCGGCGALIFGNVPMCCSCMQEPAKFDASDRDWHPHCEACGACGEREELGALAPGFRCATCLPTAEVRS